MLDVLIYFVFAVLLSFGIFIFLLIKHKIAMKRKKNSKTNNEGSEGVYYTDDRN